jgi:hypothetical protein
MFERYKNTVVSQSQTQQGALAHPISGPYNSTQKSSIKKTN